MLKNKNQGISTIVVIIALMFLPVILGACSAPVESADPAFGLRSEAVADLIEVNTNDVDESDTGSESTVLAENTISTGEIQPRLGAGNTNGNGSQARTMDRSQHVFDPAIAPDISEAEIEGLTWMREEEKLARDVYLTLYDLWGLPVFENIAASEQAHMDSILMLLDQYELNDPVADAEQGEFSNDQIQTLYDQLVAQGTLSQIDALKVGATIEEIDINDLQTLLDDTENAYILQVYNNLLAGSENHLRAFVSNLDRQYGVVYQPEYLSEEAFQTILSSTRGQGGGNGGYGGGNNTGGNGGNGNGRRNGQRNNT